MPERWARRPGWRRPGCRRPLRTGRTPRNRRFATRRPHPAGRARSRHATPRGQDSELQLLVLPPAEAALGQEPLPDSLQGQRVCPAGAAPVQRVAGQAEEDLAGEGVVTRMERLQFAEQPEQLGTVAQPAQQDPAGCGRVLGCGPLPGRHTQTVGHPGRGRAQITPPMPPRLRRPSITCGPGSGLLWRGRRRRRRAAVGGAGGLVVGFGRHEPDELRRASPVGRAPVIRHPPALPVRSAWPGSEAGVHRSGRPAGACHPLTLQSEKGMTVTIVETRRR